MLSDAERFVVPGSVVDRTDRALREAGNRHAEMFVLWTGSMSGGTFLVETAYIPAQQAHRLESGLCVTVGGPALHELNRWLYDHKQLLGVQVHSHPTEAFHSSTDSTYPIVTQRGGLSLVVPDFAARGARGTGTALYRLDGRGWQRQRGRAARKLLDLEGPTTDGKKGEEPSS